MITIPLTNLFEYIHSSLAKSHNYPNKPLECVQILALLDNLELLFSEQPSFLIVFTSTQTMCTSLPRPTVIFYPKIKYIPQEPMQDKDHTSSQCASKLAYNSVRSFTTFSRLRELL